MSPNTPMHNKGSLIHAGLGYGDEIPVWNATGPGSINVRVRMEDGAEIVPFAGVTDSMYDD